MYWASLIGTLAFATFYNWIVGRAERNGYAEGFVWFLVVIGVAVTLSAAAITDYDAAMHVFWFFVASGAPMMIGSYLRYARARKAEQDAIRRGDSDNDTAPLA